MKNMSDTMKPSRTIGVIKKCASAFLDYLKENLFALALYVLIFILYSRFINRASAILIIAVIVAYGVSSFFCYYGKTKYRFYKDRGELTSKRAALFVCLSACPIYLLWIGISAMPIVSGYAALYLAFPVAVLSIVPLCAIKESWKYRSVGYFWLLQASIALVCFSIGHFAGKLIFRF